MDTSLYKDDSISGLQKRISALQPTPPAAQNEPQSLGLAILPDPTEAENAAKTQRWAADDLISKVLGAGTRTEREAYGNALNRMVAKSPTSFSPDVFEDAMRKAGDRTSRREFGQAMALAFADGGKIDPEELMRQMAAKYKTGAPQAAPQPAPQPATQPTPQQHQPGSLLTGATNALRGRAAQIERATAGYSKGGKLKACAQGGKIQGPGSATSDSIPAQVRETGENILVSNQERIVSAEQDALLERIAQMLGFENVDMMFEQLTGKPVGPTMKAGKKAAAQGAAPGRMDEDGNYHPMTVSRTPGQPTAADRAFAQQTAGDFNKVFSDADFKKPVADTSAGPTVRDSAGGAYTPEKGFNPGQALMILLADSAQAAQSGEDYTMVRDKRRAGQQPAATPAAAVATVPGYGPQDGPQRQSPSAAPVAPPVATPGDALLGRQQTYMENNNLRSFEDVGGGAVRQIGADGRKMITNVGVGDVIDPSKRAVDDSASALIDQKNSTYNPQRQLENMQRLRMMGDLTNSSITDPQTKADAARGLAAMNAGQQVEAQAGLQNAQTDQARATTEQMKTIEAMRGKLLDPNTPPEERARMLQAIQAITGKGDRKGIKVATTSTPNPNGFGPNLQQAWAVDEDTGTVYNVEDRAKANAGRPDFTTYADAVRKHPKFKGQTLSDDQLKQMYQATYPGVK